MRARRPTPRNSIRARRFLRGLDGRGPLTLVLGGVLVWSVLQIDHTRPLVHAGGGQMLLDLLGSLVRPELSIALLAQAAQAAWLTLAYAVAGMTVALALGIPGGVLASGTLIRRPGLRRATMVGTRAVLGGARAIHELVWAWLFVVAVGLSPLVAVFALGIPYAGILGRIFADLLNDVPPGPLRSLRATGAGEPAVLLYGRVPMALPDMVAYAMYRLECGIRASAIMSFVGLGGLGFQLTLALDDLRFELAATYLYGIVLLVLVVDVWSAAIRKRMVG